MPKPDTRARILDAGLALIREGGPAALTFDAIAARIGMTKQAVLYWFPGKPALIAAIGLPLIRAEAQVAIAAARAATTPADARRRVVLALARFHLSDLPRFRILYAASQTGPTEGSSPPLESIYPITDAMYAAIAEALGGGADARRQAVALHMAALGHAVLVGLTAAVDDPMKHTPEDLAETLAALVAGPA